MKKRKGLTIKINLSNRWLYFLITLGILLIIGVGVYAAVDASQAWHPASQVSLEGTDDSLQDAIDYGSIGGAGGCPAGTSMSYDYINDGEDTRTYLSCYGNPARHSQDTCDGSAWSKYSASRCSPDESSTCIDHYNDGCPFSRYEVRCRQKMNLQCVED